MPVRPTLLHRIALASFLLFRKNLGNLREFLGKWFIAPLAKNCPYAYGFESDQRRLTLVVIKMRLLVWCVVNKTLKFRLTFLC